MSRLQLEHRSNFSDKEHLQETIDRLENENKQLNLENQRQMTQIEEVDASLKNFKNRMRQIKEHYETRIRELEYKLGEYGGESNSYED